MRCPYCRKWHQSHVAPCGDCLDLSSPPTELLDDLIGSPLRVRPCLRRKASGAASLATQRVQSTGTAQETLPFL